MTDYIQLKAPAVTTAIETIVRAGGSDAHEAKLVATNLVEANLRGHDSHGIGMIPRYVDALLEGGLVANAHASIKLDSGTLLTVDGCHGYGQVIGLEAMDLAIARAKQHGICAMGLAHSHHLGRIGHWAEQAVAAGLVSIHFVNVISRPIVAPWGGREARFGTNPCTIGIPIADREPFILDMATSQIAQGKVRVAHNKQEPLPEGILIDDAGEPTTDPRYGVIAPLGAILPFGEHKGYGLAVACELLGAALAGGMTWHDVARGERRVWNSMFAIVIDPQRLGTAANFAVEARAFVDAVKTARPGPGVDRVKIAGDPERETRARRLAEGFSIDITTWNELRAAAEKVKVAVGEFERMARG